MDWNRVEGNWKQVKGKVKEKWGKLTDDDLDVINGRRDQLEGKIQERYGIAKDQTRKEHWRASIPLSRQVGLPCACERQVLVNERLPGGGRPISFLPR